ncbi:MAG: UDP-N-acetylmuramate--L-alanine ligase [Treponema sp.]|nr:UDP-N-acetylmuramate--L-alanine ligase [Treponema sp.]
MKTPSLPRGAWFVGIKGTGMSALAELYLRQGVAVAGSDTADVFYTDAILRELGIPYREGFDPANIPAGTELVVHSAAYSPRTNSELAAALERGIPLLKYSEALGAYSAGFDSSGIAGVHGKTTTTALAGVLARAAGLDAQVLAGSAVGAFGGRSTLWLGSRFFIAETCEYRRHFLDFHPRRIVLTSVQSDHQDYYPTYESILEAFIEYCLLLPEGGELIYCADDPGAVSAAEAAASRKSITLTPYGFSASGPFRIEGYTVPPAGGEGRFTLSGYPCSFRLKMPGRHIALDAAAALALTASLSRAQGIALLPEALAAALAAFTGSKRRSEILGEAGGVLFMDDYGHHPEAIRATLEGLAAFYPGRRLVVSFMSHTYTRTAALLDGFAAAFDAAQVVILHKIYASAREVYEGGVNGRTLYERVGARSRAWGEAAVKGSGRGARDGIGTWGRGAQGEAAAQGGEGAARGAGEAAAGEGASVEQGEGRRVFYVEEPLDAVSLCEDILRPGDLFVTMGAGDNWKLGEKLFARRKASIPNSQVPSPKTQVPSPKTGSLP